MIKILRRALMTKEFSPYTVSREIIFSKEKSHKRTKIIGTIGPASNSRKVLKTLFQNGLNICRLNFSHGNHESHQEIVNKIKKVSLTERPFGYPIIMDLKGPSIRTGFLQDNKPVELKKGELLKITTEFSHIGNKDKISCSYQFLCESVKEGDHILIADGNLALRVTKVFPNENCVQTIVLNDYLLTEKKNMNLPGNRVLLETITEKDKYDLKSFASINKIDLVSVSFCRSAKDIIECRNQLGFRGKNTKIVAKIENHEGIKNYEEIVKEADATMIARGDLGMELPIEKITIAQKWMTELSRKYLKPVIVATQMLESMTTNARPTRAEISDVTNAIIDGTDCVMLSGETSAGNFPVNSVVAMRNIAEESELTIDYLNNFTNTNIYPKDKAEGMLLAAVNASLYSQSNIMIVLSENADHAKYCSALRPRAFILAPHHINSELRNMELFSALFGVKVSEISSKQQKIEAAYEVAKIMGLIEPDFKGPFLVVDCDTLLMKFVTL